MAPKGHKHNHESGNLVALAWTIHEGLGMIAAAHHTTPAPTAPPRLVRGGKHIPLLFKEGWHAKRDGVVRKAPYFLALMNNPG